MPERFLRHLRPEISDELLPLAQKLTGTTPRIHREDGLPNDVQSVLVPPERPHQPWEIHFAKGQEPFLDHIVAHHVGTL